jgi:plastocyanin
MENSKGLIVAGILILIIVAGGVFFYGKNTHQKNAAIVPTTTQQPAPATTLQVITLNPDGFSPTTITVKAGTTVRWLNKSGKLGDVDSDPHPVHTSYPSMNFGTFSDGSSVELVFDKPGTYHYHNHLIPTQQGTVIVE